MFCSRKINEIKFVVVPCMLTEQAGGVKDMSTM